MTTKLSIEELESSFAKIKGLELLIGKIVEEEWDETMGPTPYPSITDLRAWDHRLLQRYEPFYSPFCDMCCLCTFGKCDLTKGKKGSCGIDIRAQQGKIVLIACLMGAACHTTHARHILDYLIKKKGRDHHIDLGEEVELEAPLIRLVAGIKPKNLGDLEEVLDYIEKQITHLLSATATGQEESYIDFESKALHAGMIDNVALEVSDIAQISALRFPKGDPDAPLVDLGMGVIDKSKPVILCVGHNVAPGSEIINYLEQSGIYGSVEVAGICCTAHDLTRYSTGAKIVGPLSRQLIFVRSGVADVMVLDQECIRTDIIDEAKKVGTRVITTIDQVCAGLPDMTKSPVESIIKELVSGNTPAILIHDPVKAGEVAVKVALGIAPSRRASIILNEQEILDTALRCKNCERCRRNCPIDLPINEAIYATHEKNLDLLAQIYDQCLNCGRCESECPEQIPIVSVIRVAAMEKIRNEKYKMRSGRGPIKDVEIRNVGRPIVMGEIPGVIAFVGCANYSNGNKELVDMADEFAKRRYIVVASGCAAMDIARYKDENGQTLYEKYSGDFDAGCILNTGSCVSNAHIIGATIKIANIFAKRRLRGNFEEIADYILNRIGAVAIAWGAQHQKAASIATGANRLGIPVILGPQGAKYRRAYLGRADKKEDWMVYNARTGGKVYAGPAPEHLLYVTETKEEAMVTAARLVMRPNDMSKGRMIKLSHYVDLHQKLYGIIPDDLHLFVRTEADLPITMKDQLLKVLKERGWEPIEIPDPTLLERQIVRRE
ncbi:MAG: CO dehydrogenase/acetyl-CoA synthase complex subunit epsilon [archaeon]|nr:CO dehydrogenase/acetyl-CoA synthase complex subunit epsilon [archaeon]MCP8315011.1 CO dehydrogenase/acetyl-CoA synthase complex subunit epsilon [archaeon]